MDLGLERAGMRCVWQVEIDPYARRVLEKHWPDTRRWDDVRTFPPGEPDGWQCDLIAGGFPCQDVSEAGKRAGIDGKRSGLWSEFARILRVLRPRVVLVENVSGLLHRGLGRVLGDLATLGFDAEWDCIPAAAIGAPHIRERIFIVAHADDQRELQPSGCIANERRRTCDCSPPLLAEPVCNGLERVVTDRTAERPVERSSDSSLAHAASRRTRQLRREQLAAFCQGQRNLHWPQTEPPVCGVVDGVPSRVDRLRTLGNAVVPQVAEWIGRRLMESLSDRGPDLIGSDLPRFASRMRDEREMD
jgi:DNA (cytosine-5)-methyltransferase 1